jgi:transcriptional regulator with XRE-family HTH domain
MFGKAVLTMRKELRLSTEELAEQSGVPLVLLGRIENGIAGGDEWGLSEICGLAGVLNVRPDALMERWERYIEESGAAWWRIKNRKD